jgi:hypothetical protein
VAGLRHLHRMQPLSVAVPGVEYGQAAVAQAAGPRAAGPFPAYSSPAGTGPRHSIDDWFDATTAMPRSYLEWVSCTFRIGWPRGNPHRRLVGVQCASHVLMGAPATMQPPPHRRTRHDSREIDLAVHSGRFRRDRWRLADMAGGPGTPGGCSGSAPV